MNYKRQANQTLRTNISAELYIVEGDVQDGLRDIRIYFGKRIGKLGNVDRYELIWVLYPVIEVSERVECIVGEVLFC